MGFFQIFLSSKVFGSEHPPEQWLSLSLLEPLAWDLADRSVY